MKKLLTLVMAIIAVLALTANAMAITVFTGELGNESTFETLQDAHANSVAVVQNIVENTGKFVAHPALDNYPEGTTYVYRSANMYAGRAAARLNTNIFVYTEEKFADLDAAKAYLADLGLVDIIEEAVGSIVLVTPVGEAFDRVDAASYYALQTAMLSQKESFTDAEGNRCSYADAEYFGGYGTEYFIGIGGGATFFNNYIATELDFASRLAGVLLIGGGMHEFRQPAIYLPIYLVNSSDAIVAKYMAVNGVDAQEKAGAKITEYNKAWPLRKVIHTVAETVDMKAVVADAYYNMFVKAQRVPVVPQAVYTAGTPYSGYGFDQAPYSLYKRTTIFGDKTADGIVYIKHQGDDDRFAEICNANGDYINVWYEYIPEEALNGEAANGTIPLVLCNHGGGDDARVFVEEFGLLNLAADKRVALVAADIQGVGAMGGNIRDVALPALVKYMLETYPALDASRVYATGYSYGGGATYDVGHAAPELFAAVAACAGTNTNVPEAQAEHFFSVELPMLFTITAFDSNRRLDGFEGNLGAGAQQCVVNWTKNNGIEVGEFDFDKVPHFGLEGDIEVRERMNDEFDRTTWYMLNGKGEPRFAYTYIDGMVHALHPMYADIVWDFVSHYSRDLATGEVVYTP